jgi:hypothetical protein
MCLLTVHGSASRALLAEVRCLQMHAVLVEVAALTFELCVAASSSQPSDALCFAALCIIMFFVCRLSPCRCPRLPG